MTPEERNELIAGVMPWAITCFQKFAPHLFASMGKDEVRNEIWLHLINNAEKYDPARGKPTTWAFYYTHALTTALNRRSWIRGGKGAIFTAEDEALALIPESVDSEAIDFDRFDALNAALKTVDRRRREILLMCLNGSTLQEVGDRLFITRERVRQLRNQAVVAVAKKMGVNLTEIDIEFEPPPQRKPRKKVAR